MKKLIAYTFLFGSISLIIFLIILKLSLVIPSAYMSVKFDCAENIQELQNETGYIVLGTFHVENNTQTITVHNPDPMILDHELCHQKQFEEGRLFGCEHKILLFFDELSCYLR